MITPEFDIEQDSDTISLTIKSPYTRIADADIYTHENELKFYSKPYFLRLNLPGNIRNDEHTETKYDADTGKFFFRFRKETPGEHFQDLCLLTKLLAPKMKPGRKAIEEIDDICDEDLDDEEGDIWQFNQELVEHEEVGEGRQYGFNRSKTGVMGRMQESFPRACDIKEPEVKTVIQARIERLEEEKERFDSLHYIFDTLAERKKDGQIRAILENQINYDEEVDFTEEQREFLSKLPARSYLMDKNGKLRCLLGLVDVIYAYAYTNRVNECDWNSESGWTVAKLSATLSHFEEFTSMKAVKVSCFRRTLVFPLVRTYALTEVCWQDAIDIFKQGTQRVLKCLLQVHHAMEEDADGRHLLNDLYVNDYCIWLQRQCKSSRLHDLAVRMLETGVQKDEVGLNILAIEKHLADYEQNEQKDDEESDKSADSDDDDDDDSSTSAHDSDDYDSFDEWGSQEESPTTSGSCTPDSAAATNRNI